MMDEKDRELAKLRNSNREFVFLRDEYDELKINYEYKEELLTKANKDLWMVRMELDNVNVDEKDR